MVVRVGLPPNFTSKKAYQMFLAGW